jgi:hypothetical protein
MRSGYILVPFILLFSFCKKKTTTETSDPVQTSTGNAPPPGTQILKIYDADLSSSGYHDDATFFYFYDNSYRSNLVKEYDTTLTPAYAIVKINYRETTYTYNANNKVDVETITSYSPSTSVQTNDYFYDNAGRMRKKVVYYDNVYNDSTVYTYMTNKIVCKYGTNSIDTMYLNNTTQNLDSIKYMASGYMYKYINDGKVNPFKTHDYAIGAYGINPYKCDFNTKKIKTPFGNYNYAYFYNPNNYPAFYTTILSSGSGCNVTFYYN